MFTFIVLYCFVFVDHTHLSDGTTTFEKWLASLRSAALYFLSGCRTITDAECAQQKIEIIASNLTSAGASNQPEAKSSAGGRRPTSHSPRDWLDVPCRDDVKHEKKL